MEQLSIFDYMKKDWKEEIRDACTEIEKRENLRVLCTLGG